MHRDSLPRTVHTENGSQEFISAYDFMGPSGVAGQIRACPEPAQFRLVDGQIHGAFEQDEYPRCNHRIDHAVVDVRGRLVLAGTLGGYPTAQYSDSPAPWVGVVQPDGTLAWAGRISVAGADGLRSRVWGVLANGDEVFVFGMNGRYPWVARLSIARTAGTLSAEPLPFAARSENSWMAATRVAGGYEVAVETAGDEVGWVRYADDGSVREARVPYEEPTSRVANAFFTASANGARMLLLSRTYNRLVAIRWVNDGAAVQQRIEVPALTEFPAFAGDPNQTWVVTRRNDGRSIDLLRISIAD